MYVCVYVCVYVCMEREGLNGKTSTGIYISQEVYEIGGEIRV